LLLYSAYKSLDVNNLFKKSEEIKPDPQQNVSGRPLMNCPGIQEEWERKCEKET